MLEGRPSLVEAKIKGLCELQQARKACGMTQKEVAAKMGVSQKRISDLVERQHRRHAGGDAAALHHQPGQPLEITAKLPGVSLELQGLGTDHPPSLKRREPWRRTDGGDRLDQRRSLADSVALRDGVGMVNAARCGFIVIRYLLLCLYNMLGIIKPRRTNR